MANLYLLKITLVGSQPCIWRKVVVPSNITLEDLHYVIQNVMSWENDHLHMFCLGKDILTAPTDPFMPDSEEESLVLKDYLPLANRRKPLSYIYDFGDDWTHEITLEDKNYKKSENSKNIACIDGEFASPPDDIGGVYEYAEIYKLLKKKAPLPEPYDEWFEEDYDPDFFDIEEINEDLCSTSLVDDYDDSETTE